MAHTSEQSANQVVLSGAPDVQACLEQLDSLVQPFPALCRTVLDDLSEIKKAPESNTSSLAKPIVAIIVAIGPDRVIGQDNQLPWKLPRDLRFFRRVTSGNTVIMGRKTFESLGKRPLPNRKNIVISRDQSYSSRGVDVAHSIDEAINFVADQHHVFVIGGGQLYRATLPIAEEIYVTEITDQNPNLNLFPAFPGDTFFPKLDELEWELVRPGKRWFIASNRLVPSKGPNVKRTGLYFRLQVYRRRKSGTKKRQSGGASMHIAGPITPKTDGESQSAANQLKLGF